MSDTLKQLLAVLADGQFHSGTELAQILTVSRTAVWKHLQSLADWGVEVISVHGKGYKLPQPLQLLDENQIRAHLDASAKALINRFEIQAVIPSTNAYLSALAQQTHASGIVCLAEYQTAGKGRRGRTWVSPFGHNIYLSILWQYPEGPGAIAGLSLAIGVAVIRALRRLGLEEVGLKWPNDIYWRGRKLAGILIEVSGESSGPCHAVIGLGLNVYLPSQQAAAIEQAWVDLRQMLGEEASGQRNRLLGLLLNEMMPVIADFQARQLPDYVKHWRGFDCMLGRAAVVMVGTQRFEGVVQGIDDAGLLRLQDAQGQMRTFASGEVSLRPA